MVVESAILKEVFNAKDFTLFIPNSKNNSISIHHHLTTLDKIEILEIVKKRFDKYAGSKS